MNMDAVPGQEGKKSIEELKASFEQAMKTVGDLVDQFVWRQGAIDKSQYRNVSYSEIVQAQKLQDLIGAEIKKQENQE